MCIFVTNSRMESNDKRIYISTYIKVYGKLFIDSILYSNFSVERQQFCRIDCLKLGRFFVFKPKQKRLGERMKKKKTDYNVYTYVFV